MIESVANCKNLIISVFRFLQCLLCIRRCYNPAHTLPLQSHKCECDLVFTLKKYNYHRKMFSFIYTVIKVLSTLIGSLPKRFIFPDSVMWRGSKQHRFWLFSRIGNRIGSPIQAMNLAWHEVHHHTKTQEKYLLRLTSQFVNKTIFTLTSPFSMGLDESEACLERFFRRLLLVRLGFASTTLMAIWPRPTTCVSLDRRQNKQTVFPLHRRNQFKSIFIKV